MSSNRERAATQAFAHIFMGIATIFILAPFVLMVMSSFTDDQTLVLGGYGFIPKKWSLAAYEYILNQGPIIFRALGVTIAVTAIGVTLSLIVTTMLAYTISRKDVPGSGAMTVLVALTVLFNGGLVPSYIMYSSYLHINNTLFALLIPNLLTNGYTIFMVRTYYRTSVPAALLEAARIDGAGEFYAFCKIVIPCSVPIIATTGLLSAIMYWNDWFNGMIYILDPKLFSIQLILNRMLQDIQFLTSNAQLSAQASEAISKIPGTSIRMAIATIGSLPLFAAYPFFQRYFVKGITIGSVKG